MNHITRLAPYLGSLNTRLDSDFKTMDDLFNIPWIKDHERFDGHTFDGWAKCNNRLIAEYDSGKIQVTVGYVRKPWELDVPEVMA